MLNIECMTSRISQAVCYVFIASIAIVFVGCATQAKYGVFDPKPKAAPSNANAFAEYGPATKHYDGYQMAYEWQQAYPKHVADATKCEVLASFVSSDASADALLSKIGTTYDGDPVTLTQIAAVTQFVMCPKYPRTAERRQLWVAALKRARANTDDGYVRTFCDQQLRLCEK